jgi:signal recognition particle receptor subunit beta
LFSPLLQVYYKDAVGAFVVFDVTRLATYDAAAKWKNDIDSKVTVGVENKPIPVVLLANKVSLFPLSLSFLSLQCVCFVFLRCL